MTNNIRRPLYVSRLCHLDIICLKEGQTNSKHAVRMNIGVNIYVANFHSYDIVRSVDDRDHLCRVVFRKKNQIECDRLWSGRIKSRVNSKKCCLAPVNGMCRMFEPAARLPVSFLIQDRLLCGLSVGRVIWSDVQIWATCPRWKRSWIYVKAGKKIWEWVKLAIPTCCRSKDQIRDNSRVSESRA